MQFSLLHPAFADGPFPFCAARAKPASKHKAASETNNFMYLILLTSTNVFLTILFIMKIGPMEPLPQRLICLNDI
jgi:hypothetical protein